MSGLDIDDVGAMVARATVDAGRRILSLEVEIGDPCNDPEEYPPYPPHLVVQVAIGPQTVELLQAIAGVGGFERLTVAVEEAIALAAAAELDDLRGRADTLTAALQAAGPSPERVPPTDPPPAPASSPPPLAAIPGGRTEKPATRPAAARRRPAAAPARATTQPSVRRSPQPRGGRPTSPTPERIIATLADAPEPQTSSEIQAALNLPQPTVDKHLRALRDAGKVERIGPRGQFLYRLQSRAQSSRRPVGLRDPLRPQVIAAIRAGSGTIPALTAELSADEERVCAVVNELLAAEVVTASGGRLRIAETAAPPPLRGRQPIGNGKTGKISARRSGDEGSTLGGRILGSLQLADLSPESICSRLREPLADVEQALEELRVEHDVQRMPDGRYRAVL